MVAHFSSMEIVTASFSTKQGIADNRIYTALYYDRLALTHEGPERHVSCLARHYFANARKMVWSCEG